MNKKALLILEFSIICVIVPGIIIVNVWAPYMFAFLWGATLYGFLVYRYRHFNSYADLWRWSEVNLKNLKPILIRWVLASIAMVVFIMLYSPERAFYLPLHAPHVIPFIMLAYPVISALPQEFVFCTFFFGRYKPLFGDGLKIVLASAITFAYAHILYINWIAPPLSFLGGLIFAMTYLKTRSLALVTIEHALYGNVLFLTGLGTYFYSGAVTAGG